MYSSTITEYEDADDKKRLRSEQATENDADSILGQPPKGPLPGEQPMIWRNVIGIAFLHVIAVYMFVTRYREAKFWTWVWSMYLLHTYITCIRIYIPVILLILSD